MHAWVDCKVQRVKLLIKLAQVVYLELLFKKDVKKNNVYSPTFQVLKSFLETAEAEVRSLISLYSEVVSAL